MEVSEGLGWPLSATVLSVASQSPGTWAHHALAICAHLDIPSPLAGGIRPQSPPYRVRRWVDLVVSPSLNLALRQRLQTSIGSLSTTRVPHGATFSVNAGPDVPVYGRGSSPEHARFWTLAQWGHDPLRCGRPARHLGLPESCRFWFLCLQNTVQSPAAVLNPSGGGVGAFQLLVLLASWGSS